ncbi:hypothetical protein BC940DRAFT_323924 [Gongronella butleri]|nr:hypothetical protein BC940DRAFT_323924 [Gongronella butleri]
MVPPPPLPFLPALALPSPCPQQQRSLSMSAAAMGDDESPAKKKRHSTTVRKSRDIAPAPLKPLAPVKLEAMPEEPLQPQHRPSVTPTPSVTPPAARVSPAPIAAAASASPPADTHNMPEKSPAETAYAKRQERLIKNRAAALLSRKRKREHLTALEQDRLQLQADNDSLKQKVLQLESRVQSLENENTELKRKFALTAAPVKHVAPASLVTPKHAKTTGMVFMIILFSFALFTLPSSHTRDQLTVGGSPASPSMPLIGASTPSMTLDELPAAPSTDLMLINSVRPGDLQTWIQTSMDPASSNNDSTDVIQWYGQQDHADEKGAGVPPHLYLYANELAQVTPLPMAAGAGAHNNPLPESTLSLLCPLNTSSHCDSYLQIDVKVLGSSIKHGVLRSDSNKNAIVVANHPRHHNNDQADTDDMLMTEQPHRALRRKWADKQRKRVSRIVLE